MRNSLFSVEVLVVSAISESFQRESLSLRNNSLVADRAAMGMERPTLKDRSDPVGKTSDLLRLERCCIAEAAEAAEATE